MFELSPCVCFFVLDFVTRYMHPRGLLCVHVAPLFVLMLIYKHHECTRRTTHQFPRHDLDLEGR